MYQCGVDQCDLLETLQNVPWPAFGMAERAFWWIPGLGSLTLGSILGGNISSTHMRLSPNGMAPALQAGFCGFESRQPLHMLHEPGWMWELAF